MFRAHVLIIRRPKLHYTASGIITPIGGPLVRETATYKCDDTRGCVMQFWPLDDEHMCSKHVEAWKKLIVKQKFCASSWLITEMDILRCTVSKTSKKNCIFLFHICFAAQMFALYSNKHFCCCSYSIRVFGCAKPLGIISALHKKQSLSCLLQTFLPVTCRPGSGSRQKAAV